MASRFPSVSDEGIFALNEEATPVNAKRATRFDFSVFTGKKNIFLSDFAENPRETSSKKNPEECKRKSRVLKVENKVHFHLNV